jgi:sec-independent protein translocase protein TatA
MFPGNLGPGELMVVGLIAVLLFGKRLPEVGKSLGKGIVEFKKGLRGIEDDEPGFSSSGSSSRETAPNPGAIEVNVPKFEPPSAPAQPAGGAVARPYEG